MHFETITHVAQEHAVQLRQRSDRNRLIQQANAGRANWPALHCRALTWLGRQMTVWGCRLQARYGSRIEGPSLSAPHCAR